MAGDNLKGAIGGSNKNPAKSPSTLLNKHPPSSSSSHLRISRWDSSTPKTNPIPSPSPNPNPIPNPSMSSFPDPPPRPIYGFHMLDRRSIVLADGSVRSYFALPPDYQSFTGPRLPPLGPISPPEFRPSQLHLKRKFPLDDKERDDYARRKQHLLHYGAAGTGTGTGTSSPFSREAGFVSAKYGEKAEDKVDPDVTKAFLHFSKVINENETHRKNYLDGGKHGPLKCLACGGSSKDFPDVHSLIMHMYTSDNADSRVDHLGLHRALCVLMGWDYMRPPDNSRSYQFVPGDEAAANQDDLIMWPPVVIIHNTNTGKGKDGRMEGLANKAMDRIVRDLGFSGGESKSVYSRGCHLGYTLIKFNGDQSGLKEAIRLADYFENDRHGRRDWAHIQSMSIAARDDENNRNLVMIDERTGERKRIFYGYLLTATDLDKVDFETRKKTVIVSRHEKLKAQT